MVQKILNSYKSIIFLKGEFPNKKLFDYLDLTVPIIAADGAADNLKNYSITPNFNIGDGDSVKTIKSNSFIKILDQNKTDFEKAILFVKNLTLFPSLVLGFAGGEIDHVLGNAQIISKYCDKNSLFFLDTYPTNNSFGTKLGIVVSTNELFITLNKGSTITILPFEESIITTTGLKWNLKNKKMKSSSFSLRNYNIFTKLTFKLMKGRALIIIDITQEILSLKKQFQKSK